MSDGKIGFSIPICCACEKPVDAINAIAYGKGRLHLDCALRFQTAPAAVEPQVCPTCNGDKQVFDHVIDAGFPGRGWGPCPDCQVKIFEETDDIDKLEEALEQSQILPKEETPAPSTNLPEAPVGFKWKYQGSSDRLLYLFRDGGGWVLYMPREDAFDKRRVEELWPNGQDAYCQDNPFPGWPKPEAPEMPTGCTWQPDPVPEDRHAGWLYHDAMCVMYLLPRQQNRAYIEEKWPRGTRKPFPGWPSDQEPK